VGGAIESGPHSRACLLDEYADLKARLTKLPATDPYIALARDSSTTQPGSQVAGESYGEPTRLGPPSPILVRSIGAEPFQRWAVPLFLLRCARTRGLVGDHSGVPDQSVGQPVNLEAINTPATRPSQQCPVMVCRCSSMTGAVVLLAEAFRPKVWGGDLWVSTRETRRDLAGSA